MNIGTGLFAGGAIIAMVALFVAAKDRWNWRTVAMRGLAVAVCAIAIGWLSEWAWTWYSERPFKQSELWGVKLGDPLQDVRFKKGLPTEERNPETGLSYIYKLSESALASVRFKNEKVRGVILYGVQSDSPYRELQGIRFGDTSKQITDRFGDSALITSSKDGLTRLYAFPDSQIFFGLSTDKVEIFGIYDPSYPLPVGVTDRDEKQ